MEETVCDPHEEILVDSEGSNSNSDSESETNHSNLIFEGAALTIMQSNLLIKKFKERHNISNEGLKVSIAEQIRRLLERK